MTLALVEEALGGEVAREPVAFLERPGRPGAVQPSARRPAGRAACELQALIAGHLDETSPFPLWPRAPTSPSGPSRAASGATSARRPAA